LLAKGAKVNVKDKKGRTPLVCALTGKHGDVAKLIRQHGGK